MAAKQEMIHIVAKAVISLNKWITRSLIVFLKSLTEQWFTASSFLKAQLRIKSISYYKSVEFRADVLFVCLFIQFDFHWLSNKPQRKTVKVWKVFHLCVKTHCQVSWRLLNFFQKIGNVPSLCSWGHCSSTAEIRQSTI